MSKLPTNDPILLVMDNCAAQNDATFKGHSGQVRVVFLPPNCTIVNQSTDCGIISPIKKLYCYRLLWRCLRSMMKWCSLEQNKGRTQGTNGLDEGYPPHIRNCIEIYFAWKATSRYRCWYGATNRYICWRGYCWCHSSYRDSWQLHWYNWWEDIDKEIFGAMTKLSGLVLEQKAEGNW